MAKYVLIFCHVGAAAAAADSRCYNTERNMHVVKQCSHLQIKMILCAFLRLEPDKNNVFYLQLNVFTLLDVRINNQLHLRIYTTTMAVICLLYAK